MSMPIEVFVSSKMGELETERAIAKEQIIRSGLSPVLADDWAPSRESMRQVYLESVKSCHIYLGIFHREYSEATIEEYGAAASNPYREIIIYIKSSSPDARDPKLLSFIKDIATRHVYFEFQRPEILLTVVPMHLHAAISRMINLLMNLGMEAKSGVKWGDLPSDNTINNPSQEFLKYFGFPDGVYNEDIAKSNIEQLQSLLDKLRRYKA